MKTKFIFVLGGVMSGLGKGISASSIGYLLKSAGLKVNILNKKNNSGKVTIEYKDLDQFELISDLLTKH